eukprot:CAMPEP_0113303694 /NCGR_PEP_ID=MMETSP0010_2-20120614/4004_1 /TAXON_ID=216773 ORGANISM="Corethron hystrix, Strain 308" /NCGR_SAMPLE_ID=MMETSP0010_2 /ASSEMBLY_ACC=CAM_ASM_000155 /LENGTH=467 /DNA_ID=CAMNT_0000157735 /DNA_START=189 /DNA_END=1592 /DNA_ORIENTATION=- /assembly_acc=CAM_ASM_000155
MDLNESGPRHQTASRDLVKRKILRNQHRTENIDQENFHDHNRPRLSSIALSGMTDDPTSSPFRMLYIVTTFYSLSRWENIVVPTIRHAASSISSIPSWTIDVVIVIGNEGPGDKALQMLEDILPENIGLELWENACPLGYDGRDKKILSGITRALARQHRYVIADRIDEYDFFAAWEDDMRIDADMVRYYLEVSAEIDRMRLTADDFVPDPAAIDGPMNPAQLRRVIPGFIRVEVMRDMPVAGVQTGISVDPRSAGAVNVTRCCGVPEWDKERLPYDPKAEELMTWECRIHGMSVRKFPEPIGWAALIPGPRNMPKSQIIGSRWSGASGAFGDEKKSGERDPQLFAQQGGWMATREQVLYFNDACPEGFLPPFKKESLRKHGMDPTQPHNVEFWSGGFQLFGTCNMQRIIVLNPIERFSGHLIYHSANQKQSRVTPQRHVRVTDLLGELLTVVREAEEELIATTDIA